MLRRSRSFLHLAALCGATALLASCGENARLPTDLGGGSGPAGSPRLIAGDAVRVLASRPDRLPERCVDLPAADRIMSGEPVWVCIPLAGHSTGVNSLKVTGSVPIGDPLSGPLPTGEVFEPYVATVIAKTPITKRTIMIPKLLPREDQWSGPLLVTVAAGADSLIAEYTAEASLRTRPYASILSPEAGKEFLPGDSVAVRVALGGEFGVSTLQAQWSDALSLVRGTHYSPALQRDTVDVGLRIPTDVVPAPLTLTLVASDPDGVSSMSVSRTFLIAGAASVERDPPVISYPYASKALPDGVENGDTLRVRATDERDSVSVVGLAIFTRDLSRQIWADSVVLSRPQASFGAAFMVPIPDTFAYGEYVAVGFARDKSSLRGWANGDQAGVNDLSLAKLSLLRMAAGETALHPHASFLADIEVHPARREVFLSNSNEFENRIEVLNADQATFAASIRVGSKPRSIAFARDDTGAPTSRLVVGNSGAATLSIVDVATRSVVAEPYVPGVFMEVDWLDPNGNAKKQRVGASDRPFDVEVSCSTALCASHTVFMTNVVTREADTLYSVVRSMTLSGSNTLTALDVSTPEWGVVSSVNLTKDQIQADSSQITAWGVDRTVGDTPLLWQRTKRSTSGTVFMSEPSLAVAPQPGVRRVYVAADASSSLPFLGPIEREASSHLMTMNPDSAGWSARQSPHADYTRSTNDFARDVVTNHDGSLVGAMIRSEAVILNQDLNRLATLGMANTIGAVAFVEGHTALTRDLANGGLVAAASSVEPVIDVYETRYFRLVARFPVRDRVIGPLAFYPTSDGSLVLVGVTGKGVVVIRTTLERIQQMAANP